MKRLNKEQIEKINKEILEGKSLANVSSSQNLNKSTVYYHFRKAKGKSVFPVKKCWKMKS